MLYFVICDCKILNWGKRSCSETQSNLYFTSKPSLMVATWISYVDKFCRGLWSAAWILYLIVNWINSNIIGNYEVINLSIKSIPRGKRKCNSWITIHSENDLENSLRSFLSFPSFSLSCWPLHRCSTKPTNTGAKHRNRFLKSCQLPDIPVCSRANKILHPNLSTALSLRTPQGPYRTSIVVPHQSSQPGDRSYPRRLCLRYIFACCC